MVKSFFILVIITLFYNYGSAYAIYSPTSQPNNRVGVHILSPDELGDAAKLVNSSGGDWGYVTVPLSSTDRDSSKWSAFFRACATRHIIPIIRLATYFDGTSWVTPTTYDLVDFANFLAEMPWPTHNRYVILFNEPNHAAEWGGVVDPGLYANLLAEAKSIFTSRTADFFLLSAGLDMSSSNTSTSMDALYFYRLMTAAQPAWYAGIDGLAVHAYPNPGFSAPMTSLSRFGPKSYLYEISTLRSLGYTDPKPVFITETGNQLGTDIYPSTFTEVWTESNIVTVTPFLLFAGVGDFTGFSLLDSNRLPKSSYAGLLNFPKTAGSPLLNPDIISPVFAFHTIPAPLPTPAPGFLDRIRRVFSPAQPRLTISSGSTPVTIDVVIADTPGSRSQGLSGQPSLSQDQGMLFTFPDSQLVTFWMKDMLFPLDFVWINQSQIIGLTTDVPPPAQTGGQPQVVVPSGSVDQVLEVNAGFISAHNIKIGDLVSIIK